MLRLGQWCIANDDECVWWWWWEIFGFDNAEKGRAYFSLGVFYIVRLP